MSDDRSPSRSRKISALLKRFADKAYRDQFVASRARRFLAHQMRELRGQRSQSEFGKVLDKPQSVVSRLEDPNYGKWTVQTLLDVASKVDRAVIVQFVTYDEFAEFTNRSGRYDAPIPFNDAQKIGSQPIDPGMAVMPPTQIKPTQLDNFTTRVDHIGQASGKQFAFQLPKMLGAQEFADVGFQGQMFGKLAQRDPINSIPV